MTNYFISICIPAYKNAVLFERLLHSIKIQTYTNFDVIVTDDSSDDGLAEICKRYQSFFKLNYVKNPKPLGSPANWNACIALATGNWIKIMHHDDWFTGNTALAAFADAASNSTAKFIFSGFHWHNGTSILRTHNLSKQNQRQLSRMPLLLFKENVVGNPSTTLIKNAQMFSYDERLKWVVDFEFYMRVIAAYGLFVIPKPIVNIGIGSHQITATAFRNPEVEVPENIYLLQKLGTGILKNRYVYDYYWRFLRNLNIRSVTQLRGFTADASVPLPIITMLNFQRTIPMWILKFGPASKILMGLHFLSTQLKN